MMQRGSRLDRAIERTVDRLMDVLDKEIADSKEAERLTQEEKRRLYEAAMLSESPQAIPDLIAQMGEEEFLRQANLAVDRMVRSRKVMTAS